MKLLRFADLVASPWKNGGGITWEYAVHPEGAGLNDFSWRVSRARVATPGAFSIFSGIDRTLTVVEGSAIDLHLPDRRVRLDRFSAPFAFSGDLAIESRIPDGPIEDLNVMTRRDRWAHAVERHTISAPITLTLSGDAALLVALSALRVDAPDHDGCDLAKGDAVLLGSPTTMGIAPHGSDAEFLTIRLDRLDAPRAA